MIAGMEKGIEEICKEFNLIHIPEVERTEFGTPLVSSVFQLGQSRTNATVLCYINSDIMLMNDFLRATETIAAQMPKFLMVGQRTDLDIREAWNFDSVNWEENLRTLLAQKGTLHAPNGIDFFCFPRGMFTDIPPLVIGRPGFDNWLVWRARVDRVPIVDVTEAVKIVHQNHKSTYVVRTLSSQEYSSIKTRIGSSWLKSDGNWVELIPDSQQNIMLVPDDKNLNIWAATWMVDQKGKLKPRRLVLKPAYLYYQLRYVVPIYWPAFGKVSRWIVTVVKDLLQRFTLRIHSGPA